MRDGTSYNSLPGRHPLISGPIELHR